MFRYDLRRNQSDHDENAQGHNDDVVHIAQDRHEVGNQINGRERIAGNTKSQRLGVPRHARIARRPIDRVHVPFGKTCPLSRALNHCAAVSHAASASTTYQAKAFCHARRTKARSFVRAGPPRADAAPSRRTVHRQRSTVARMNDQIDSSCSLSSTLRHGGICVLPLSTELTKRSWSAARNRVRSNVAPPLVLRNSSPWQLEQ